MKTHISWAVGVSLVLSAVAGGAFSFLPPMAAMPPVGSAMRSAAPTPSSAQIRIISPIQNGIVPVGQTKVQVSIDNIASDAAHSWRLYLDGKLIDTFGPGETSYTLPIGVSGPHEIKATLSDSQNNDLASASVQVTAAPETPSSSPFNLAWVAPLMGAFLLGVALLIVVSLRMTRVRPEA